MKQLILTLSAALFTSLAFAQLPPPKVAEVPKVVKQIASPLDSSSVVTNDGVSIKIRYGSPSLKGREIGVEIAKVGQRWRTGANETTTVEFNKDVTVNGKKLSAGKYALNTIPGESSSTIIFNTKWKQWGTEYDENQDVLKLDVPNETSSTLQERLKITAEKSGKIHIAWGNYGLSMNVKAAK